jgi:hypothetical protein
MSSICFNPILEGEGLDLSEGCLVRHGPSDNTSNYSIWVRSLADFEAGQRCQSATTKAGLAMR